ncbi:MAG: MFS transporter [Planctomycetes bacterium]|nr:MFS transporter [Planctomycetota bacterium]
MATIAAVMLAFPDPSSQVALITLAGVVPQFFFYPMIGSVVDGMDRRRLLWGVCLLKAPTVWAMMFLLLGDLKSDYFRTHWFILLPVIFLLSLFTVPFGPARASSIPDVVPEEETGIAASLLAVTGLVSILLGTYIGGTLADKYKPYSIIPMASGFYIIATLMLRALPDAVAVPGMKRKAANGASAAAAVDTSRGGSTAAPPAEGGKVLQFFRNNWAGLKYCLSKKGVAALIVFEASFWITAVAFYTLITWHSSLVLHLAESGRIFFFSVGLGCAGLGLFLGALTIGKFSARISPLFTYPIAYVLIGLAMHTHFGAQGAANPERALLEFSERYQTEEVLREVPEAERAGIRALAERIAGDTKSFDRARIEKLDAENMALAKGLFPFMFLLGLGGGLLLGRIDADMLAITDETMRGRVFSIKGFIFTSALMGPLFVFGFYSHFDVRWNTAHFMPPAMMLGFFAVLPLAWMLDVGIYANPKKLNMGGPLERFTFYTARFIAWCIAKVYFRIHIEGRDKVPESGPVMLVGNHGSFLDPVWLGICMKRRVQYIMHSSYYYSWAHPFFRFMICIPVDEASQIRALKEGSKALAQGICIGMFPEGTVTRTGQMSKPKMGAMFLAQRAGATVVPCAIRGNTEAFPRSAKFPKPSKVTILVGEPFKIPEDASREEVARASDKAMAEIAKMLGIEPPPSCMEDLKDRKRPKDGDDKNGGGGGASPTPVPHAS